METLRYVVLVNGLLAVVSVAFYLLLRRETFFSANRLALWLGLASALILPLIDLPDWRPQPVRSAMQRTAQVIVPKVLSEPYAPSPDVTITFPNLKTYRAFKAQQQRFVWSWQTGLALLYCLGVLWLLIRFVGQLLSLQKLIRKSVQEPYTDFTLVQGANIPSPFSFFSWVFVNPVQHTPDELDQILRHERVHVRERHSFDMIGAELVCILFWYNPAAYLFRKLLQQTLEFSADRAVLAEGVDAKLYQYNLLKVSLASGQSAITNHFNRSQLKSRISMLNRSKSTQLSWLKYPVLILAALTVASAFARPQLKELTKHLSRNASSSLTSISESLEVIPKPTEEQTASDDGKTTPSTEHVLDTQPTLPDRSMVDSISQQPKKDSTRVSPSRYMVYQGDYLYWIVTPKTTLDDFFIIKKEFAKHGSIMQLNEIKYDPLYAYIDQLVFTVQRASGGMARCDETEDDNKPIPSIAGFLGIGPKTGSAGTGALKYYKNDFPEALRRTAAEEETTVAQFVKAHRLEYLIHEGDRKFKDLGNGASTYSKEYFKSKSIRNSGLIVNTDGSLSVDQELGAIRVFINNEPREREDVSNWKVDQLYSVVKKSQYNPAKKESFTSALLIYIEDN